MSYSLDGKNWTDVDATLQMSFSLDYFTGYRTGLYSFCTGQAGGYADFDYFRQAVYWQLKKYKNLTSAQYIYIKDETWGK